MAKELDLSRYFAIDQQALLESVMEAVTNEELEKNMEGIAGLMPEEKNDEDKDDNMRLVIRRTKSLIHEFYARGITLDEIAEKLQSTGAPGSGAGQASQPNAFGPKHLFI